MCLSLMQIIYHHIGNACSSEVGHTNFFCKDGNGGKAHKLFNKHQSVVEITHYINTYFPLCTQLIVYYKGVSREVGCGTSTTLVSLVIQTSHVLIILIQSTTCSFFYIQTLRTCPHGHKNSKHHRMTSASLYKHDHMSSSSIYKILVGDKLSMLTQT